jgi:hypothetical protein
MACQASISEFEAAHLHLPNIHASKSPTSTIIAYTTATPSCRSSPERSRTSSSSYAIPLVLQWRIAWLTLDLASSPQHQRRWSDHRGHPGSAELTERTGKQKVMYALTKIKGVGRRYSNLVCKKADVDLNKRYGTTANLSTLDPRI